MWPAGVHSENDTSARSTGLTHRSVPEKRLDHHPGLLQVRCAVLNSQDVRNFTRW